VLRIAFAAIVLTLVLADSSDAAEYPILFVHGFCSESKAWDPLFRNLPRARFGDEMARFFQGADGGVYLKEETRSNQLQSFTIDFYDRTGRTFDARAVADISIVTKVEQLKAVIDQIKASTGKSKVIIVSHSMGGLVSRSYVQGWSLDSSGQAIPYEGDVAGVITIDTPHSGSDLADIPLDLTPWDRPCGTSATQNKAEMTPGSAFLTNVNNRCWPATTRLDAIASYALLGTPTGDGIVTLESQNIANVSAYWARHLSVQVYFHRFLSQVIFVPGLTEILHSFVLRADETSSRIESIIEEIDRATLFPPVMNDDFNYDCLDNGLWDTAINPTGGRGGGVRVVNQRLEVTLNAGATNVGIRSICSVAGDFDVQVDFKLLQWSSNNRQGLSIGAVDLGQGPFGINRIARFSERGDFYHMVLPAGVTAFVSTSATSGALRLARTGTTLRAYYGDGATFKVLGTTQVSTAPTRFALNGGLFRSDAIPASFAFDNFIVTSGTPTCP
jgi:pimeloyl-ACP methyl ester carboxylesterase